jgi:hypothetical protein
VPELAAVLVFDVDAELFEELTELAAVLVFDVDAELFEELTELVVILIQKIYKFTNQPY